MRKSIYFPLSSLLLFLVFSFLIHSCSKEVTTQEATQEDAKGRTVIPECQQGYHYDTYLKKCIPDCPSGYEWSERSGTCVQSTNVLVTYAGVSITYETMSKMLKFKSSTDLKVVLDQLESDYENHSLNYENQYPNLTAAELDNMDATTGFDANKPYKDFEGKFGTFSSKRAELESLEVTYLSNNFTGIDPDSIDLSYEDEFNTILNRDNQFKIGSDIYTLKEDGLYVTSGSPQVAKILVNDCFTNRRTKKEFTGADPSEKYKLKVAIHSNILRASVKGKVVHFRYKNGKWKRERKDLAIAIAGTYYDKDCNNPVSFSKGKPTDSDFKKRGEIKVAFRSAWGFVVTWKTIHEKIGTKFFTPDGSAELLLVY